jgi:hypothetical protein
MQVDIQDNDIIVTEIKLMLVMSKSQFLEYLKRGKSYTRQRAMAQRLAKVPQAPRMARAGKALLGSWGLTAQSRATREENDTVACVIGGERG